MLEGIRHRLQSLVSGNNESVIKPTVVPGQEERSFGYNAQDLTRTVPEGTLATDKWSSLRTRNFVQPVDPNILKKHEAPLAPATSFPERPAGTGETLKLMRLASTVDQQTWVHDVRGMPTPCADCGSHEEKANAAQTMLLVASPDAKVELLKFEWVGHHKEQQEYLAKYGQLPFEHKIGIIHKKPAGGLLHMTMMANVSGHLTPEDTTKFAELSATDGYVFGARWLDKDGNVLEERESVVKPLVGQEDKYETFDPKGPRHVHYAAAQDISIPVKDKINGVPVHHMELYSYPVGSMKEVGYKQHRIYKLFNPENAPALQVVPAPEQAAFHNVAKNLDGRGLPDGVEGY